MEAPAQALHSRTDPRGPGGGITYTMPVGQSAEELGLEFSFFTGEASAVNLSILRLRPASLVLYCCAPPAEGTISLWAFSTALVSRPGIMENALRLNTI